MSAGTDTAVRLMRLRDAAAAYGVGYDFLLEAVQSGDLPALMPSKAWLVTPDDVMALIRSRHEAREQSA